MFSQINTAIITIIAITAIAAMGTAVQGLEISDVIQKYNYEGAEKMLNIVNTDQELAIEPVQDLNALVVYENNHDKEMFILTGLVFQEDHEIHNYFEDLE